MKALRLREWREAQGQTQAMLAERSGVSEHTISRIESGASLHPSTARKLSSTLGITVVDLMRNPPALVGAFPKAKAPRRGGAPEIDLEQLHRAGIPSGRRDVETVNAALADLWRGHGETARGCVLLAFVLEHSDELFTPAQSEALEEAMRRVLESQ